MNVPMNLIVFAVSKNRESRLLLDIHYFVLDYFVGWVCPTSSPILFGRMMSSISFGDSALEEARKVLSDNARSAINREKLAGINDCGNIGSKLGTKPNSATLMASGSLINTTVAW
jgi:hypothetical protein